MNAVQESITYEPEPTPVRGNLRRLTLEWIDRNPEVFRMFERYALEMVLKGRRFGINLLRERVRWDCIYNYEGEDFKFCNSFSPYVARELLRLHPELADFMRFRKTRF